MARAGKSTTKSGGKKTAPGAILQQLSVALTVLLLGALGAATYLYYPALQERSSELKREPLKVVMEWPPLAAAPAAGKGAKAGGEPGGQSGGTWLRESLQYELVKIAENALSNDPFDRDSLERCAAQLTQTGWIKSVRMVRREPGGVVRIVSDWRTPALVVRHDDTDYLVSIDGDLLPVTFKPGGSGLRVILNPAYPPPQQPGDRWLGGDVQAALTLMAYLQPHKAWPQVIGFDVEKYARSHRLAIISDRGNRVVWGAAPGETRVGEPSVKDKLARLDQLLIDPAFNRRIDAGMPLVDLSSPRGVLIDASATPLTIPAINPVEPEDERLESPNEALAAGQHHEGE